MEQTAFEVGDDAFIGTRFVGIWIGINPVTDAEVVWNEAINEYRTYHSWQISRTPVTK